MSSLDPLAEDEPLGPELGEDFQHGPDGLGVGAGEFPPGGDAVGFNKNGFPLDLFALVLGPGLEEGAQGRVALAHTDAEIEARAHEGL